MYEIIKCPFGFSLLSFREEERKKKKKKKKERKNAWKATRESMASPPLSLFFSVFLFAFLRSAVALQTFAPQLLEAEISVFC